MDEGAFIAFFRDIGFPAGVAAVLLWFAWHVSRALLASHNKFLDGITDAIKANGMALESVSKDVADAKTILDRQSCTIDRVIEVQSKMHECLMELRRLQKRDG